MRSELSTDRTLEACHRPPFVVVTPSSVNTSAIFRRELALAVHAVDPRKQLGGIRGGLPKGDPSRLGGS